MAIRLYITRYIGCLAALAAGCALFDQPLEPQVFAWAALLALLYAVVKPLYSLAVLPLDMLLFGLGTLCLDALMIRIAMPYGFFYWQQLAIAALIMVCFIPYEMWRSVRQ
ncbi:MAG: phage holin family protein [Oscillospiraceae bacterium]|nr:phage holin family protein [Oscillospiraceae bacterium]